jgi:GNAT superfamily N-acetyltransferase
VEGARAAEVADLAVVEDLWRRALDELGGLRGGDILASDLTRPDLAGMLRADLDDPDRMLAVGTIDETLVGMAAAHRRGAAAGSVAVVDLVYVEPEARQVGVGEALIDLVTAWAEELGCRGVDAPALPGSRSTKAFFEAHGFQARLLVMHHPINART